MGSDLVEWNEKEFNDFLKSKQNGLVIFSAPWCSSCKVVTPLLSELKKDFENIPFAKIDVSKNPGLASRMGVMSLPNILIFKEGKVADQIIGSTSKSILEKKLKSI